MNIIFFSRGKKTSNNPWGTMWPGSDCTPEMKRSLANSATTKTTKMKIVQTLAFPIATYASCQT